MRQIQLVIIPIHPLQPPYLVATDLHLALLALSHKNPSEAL